MTRKESEKESDRPHYYSQFWLDIAAGRRTIGGPRPNDEAETFEPELELDNVPLHRSGRNSNSAIADGYEETIAHPEVEPAFDADEYAEPALDEVDLDDEVEDEEIPNIVVEDTEIPDVDLTPTEDEVVADEVPADEFEDEEEFFDEDEDEDDLNWNAGRGKKKPKPRGATKLPPKPPAKKPGKREPRRGF